MNYAPLLLGELFDFMKGLVPRPLIWEVSAIIEEASLAFSGVIPLLSQITALCSVLRVIGICFFFKRYSTSE